MGKAMDTIDLLGFEGAVDEEVMEDALRTQDITLQFNGREVWGFIVLAIVSGKRTIAARLGIKEALVTPERLDVALYHPDEKALYVAVDYRVRGSGPEAGSPTLREERRIECGEAPATVTLSEVSTGTSTKMLEFLEVIDLTRVIWLPLRS